MGATTIYLHLLSDALAVEEPDGPHTSTGELLAVLIARRDGLPTAPSPTAAVHDAVGAHLAYDVALVRFCEHLGLETDLDRYRHPEEGRRLHEDILAGRGIDLARLSAGDLPLPD